MLAVTARLQRSDQFSRVIRSGKRLALGRKAAGHPVLLLHYFTDTSVSGAAPSRVGLIIGRSVGNSVRRHRLARRLRHLMRSRLPHLPPATDVVIRALPAAAEADSERLGAQLDALLCRIGGGSAAQPTSNPPRVSS